VHRTAPHEHSSALSSKAARRFSAGRTLLAPARSFTNRRLKSRWYRCEERAEIASMYNNILFIFHFPFDRLAGQKTVSWLLERFAQGNPCLSQQSPVLSVVSFVSIPTIYSRQSTPTSPWSRTRQSPAWPSRCEISTSPGAYLPQSHLKPPTPPLSDYPNTTANHAVPALSVVPTNKS
jgi:hypothetical protein